MVEILAALREEKAPQNSGAQIRVFQLACSRAGENDLPELAGMFAACAEYSYTKGELFSALADARLRLEAARRLGNRTEFPDTGTLLPALPDGYPEELRGAVQQYLQVVEPFRKLEEANKGTLDFQAHGEAYGKLLAELVGGGPGPFTGRVLAFRWGMGCLGSERFSGLQSSAQAVALSRDGRWTEAVGAVLSHPPHDVVDGALQILSATLPDPGRVVAGGLALMDLTPKGFSGGRSSLLAMLLLLPGDERVEMLIFLASYAPPEAMEAYFCALGKFAAQRSAQAPRSMWREVDRSSSSPNALVAEPVGEEAQKRALDFLCAQAAPELPIDAAKELARSFEAKPRPESLPALRRLLEHPALAVASAAAKSLAAAGEKAQIPAKLGPVSYCISVDGKPYANRSVEWAVARGAGLTNARVRTDARGVVSVPRDVFVDSAAPVHRVALCSLKMARLSDPWFEVTLGPPPASIEIIPVEVTTQSQHLELTLPRPKEQFDWIMMEVTLRSCQGLETPGVGSGSTAKLTLPASEEITFSKLMPGVYRVEIHLPGAMPWSGELRVGSEFPPTGAQLKYASDVRYTLRLPRGWGAGDPSPVLMKEGVSVPFDWDHENSRLRGVTEGKYNLRIPSSADLKRHLRGIPDDVEFAGVDVPFKVGADSPIEINLGEIRLK